MITIKRSTIVLIVALICGLTAAACGGGSADSAAKAVESYLTLRNNKDVNKLLAVSCKDWEGQATAEIASFQSMNASLDSLSCQPSGTDGQFTVVKCSGKLSTQYQAETPRVRDLSERNYKAIQEDGQWKMCGYQ